MSLLVANQIRSATKLVLVKRLHRKLSSFCAVLKDSHDQENNLLIFFADDLSLPGVIWVLSKVCQNCDKLQQKLANTLCIFNLHTASRNRYCLCWESIKCELANCCEHWKSNQESLRTAYWSYWRSNSLLKVYYFLISWFLRGSCIVVHYECPEGFNIWSLINSIMWSSRPKNMKKTATQ